MTSETNNSFELFLRTRSNLRSQWYGFDSLENYKRVAHTTNYSADSVFYEFNSRGFRCDEFDVVSDFPVVFLGCSNTEGAGLPKEHVWAHRLIEKIRERMDGNVAYWNLGISGAGLDTIAESLYWFSQQTAIKPKLILGLFPDIYRREIRRSDIPPHEFMWLHGLPAFRGLISKEVEYLLIDEEYAKHQTRRSLLTINSLRMYFNCPLFFSLWTLNPLREIYDEFPFNYIEFPDKKKFNTTFARDGVHFNPELHNEIASRFWTAIESYVK